MPLAAARVLKQMRGWRLQVELAQNGAEPRIVDVRSSG